MGDFTEHILFGFLAGFAVIYMLEDFLFLAPSEAVAGSLAVLVGSVLPDIDHKNSYVHRSVKAFTSLSLAAFMAYSAPLPVQQRFILGATVFLVVYTGFTATKIRHRGITHSVSFLVIVSSVVTLGSLYTLYSIVPGVAMAIGVLSHLLLDRELKLE